ncbi:DUF1365 domain-containing protein [Undibacterium sp. LX40W]|uniref:DUF1365 domain-containing protein n=1 Tax=Undibacterium nitidum TaxID=2762298 RepID=A0A923KS25_9BURK|nr:MULTISPECIES: DUF1365 domain-containing protein [Undibacterium]MBC3880004.1 DUF1365 domain-containing protein [Undibacterium nitidum]MBC3891260.1 DUF1365 domain-containing protein [Undibacterium sp. LX40W]
MKLALRSKLLVGKVMHERMHPKSHRFVYPIFLLRLDLQELENNSDALNSAIFGVNKWRPLSIYLKDYGPRDGSSLFVWANKLLVEHGMQKASRIELQSFPRIFSYAFNPICIWYCFDQQDELLSVIAEVNNTFGDHHFYLLTNSNENRVKEDTILQSVKSMHVSPFCEVKGRYEFQFKDNKNHSVVKIDYFEDQDLTIKTAIGATIKLFTPKNLLIAFAKQPLLTFGVFWRIHWQAFLLWSKAVPFFRLPQSSKHKITIGTPIREEH